MASLSQVQNPTSANQMLNDIEELTISLVIKNFNPNLLSYELLTMSGIVPADWELARQPVASPRGSQVSFKNGVNIIAQPNTISFVEGLGNKDIKSLEFANIAQKYVSKMSNAEYQGISISPKIIVPFTQGEEGGKDFINNTLLNQGAWFNFGNIIPQASLNLFYQLDRSQLVLNINPAKLQQPNETTISAVLFAGSFNYNLNDLIGDLRIKTLTNTINSWQKDLDTFRELIYQKFLQKAVSEKASLFES
ncbi:hypothetical protein ACN4EE_04760 [Geminocystis sp. CENA526]|uniref:hypothetical protein n=1 Tax=Geminocystis sp. CENA526 TaxID=1355871 RepID=UPI003D700D79